MTTSHLHDRPAPPAHDDRPAHPSRRGWAAEPLPPPAESVAVAAERRAPGPWRAPALAAVASYLAITALLLAAGWLLVHTGAGAGIRRWDDEVTRNLSLGRTSGWSDVSDVGTSGANTVPVVGAMVAVTAVLAVLRRWRDMLLVPLALGLELSAFLTVNYVVARERPDVAQLGGEPSTHSFPSGHAAATFVLWFGVAVLLGTGHWRARWRWLAWALFAVPVVTVAFSRVYRGMHHPTDVVAGLVLGALALGGAALATRSSWLGAEARR